MEEVCQWLDLVGMGSFKRSFRDKGVNGHMLLHMDIKTLGKLHGRQQLLALQWQQ